MNCDCGFKYYNAADPMDYWEETAHSQSHGCICEWHWRGGVDGGPTRDPEKANCPYHKVMF